tara:strand:- start:72 stop:230 length:159 start_codon:yes stop_codon:yes gene_type:complete
MLVIFGLSRDFTEQTDILDLYVEKFWVLQHFKILWVALLNETRVFDAGHRVE